jgi:hypothetical protein
MYSLNKIVWWYFLSHILSPISLFKVFTIPKPLSERSEATGTVVLLGRRNEKEKEVLALGEGSALSIAKWPRAS